MMPFERVFRDKDGFTTVGVALALLITLSLVFSSAQVYRINSASAETQAVADAAALAAMNEVAEFVIVVRFCDAVLLTMSLTSLVVLGLSVAAMCTPVTFELSGTLLQMSGKVAEARDSFALKAEEMLNKLQRALPVLAAANAMSTAQANGSGEGRYVALAVLVPWEGQPLVVGSGEALSQAVGEVSQNSENLKEHAQQAEVAAEKANQAKTIAFEHDCGFNPGYCMYERASSLAGLGGASNPYYASVDAWSFSVALSRARAYYAARSANEVAGGLSVEERARSALRSRLYDYARDVLSGAYVKETEGSFQARFPLLPKNTAEMRETELYTEEAYPVSSSDDGLVMHAWSGCPGVQGSFSLGSISQMETGDYETCDLCGFTASSMGKVAAASSSIESGFEYHYRAVAEAASEYQKARADLDPLSQNVEETATGLFGEIENAFKQVSGDRLLPEPPGSQGVVALVVNPGPVPMGFLSGFVESQASISVRAALSAATMVEEPAGEGGDVIASALDGLGAESSSLVNAASIALSCWSCLLQAYSDGYRSLQKAVSVAADAVSFESSSGLGVWAVSALDEMVVSSGLQPADLNACKPVLVNSHHVASGSMDSFCATLMGVKQQSAAYAGGSLAQLAASVGNAAIDAVFGQGDAIQIATIQIVGPGGPVVPIEITLPPAVRGATSDLVDRAAAAFGDAVARFTGVRVWE